MPTEDERVCCLKKPENCLRNMPGFDICVLNEQVLRLAVAHRNDLLGQRNLRDGNSVEERNRSLRHAAYRQLTLMRYGRLGEGVRMVIPSCCVWKIRRFFPDPNGFYEGFRAARI